MHKWLGLRQLVALSLALFSQWSLASLSLLTEPVQGALVRATVPAGSQVSYQQQKIRVSQQGEFVFGIGRDEQGSRTIEWVSADGQTHQQSFEIIPRQFAIEKVDGLPPKMVNPDPSLAARIRADAANARKARERNDERLDFMQDFIWPAKGRISGVYGSQRILNGEPKTPHYGVDVAAPTGTAVVAPASGIVTLWQPDMYYSGGTLIIDHGFGVSSTFLHLSASHVQTGQRVEQGQLIAEIGATGRATGPHLDWRMNWMNVRVDPQLLVPAR